MPEQQTDKDHLTPNPAEGVGNGVLEASELLAGASSNTAALAEAFQRFHETEAVPLEHIDDESGDDVPHVLVVPAGKRVVSLKAFRDQYLKIPERQRGTARFTELASFVSHVNRTKTGNTVIFGDVSGGTNLQTAKLIAVYDYNSSNANASVPDWQTHRAEYSFPFSDEWKAWKEHEGEAHKMGIQKFAEFLEERVMDVALPSAITKDSIAAKMQEQLGLEFASPSRLIQISKNFTLNVDSQFSEASDVQGGAKNFTFIEKGKDAAGQPFKVEGGFLINIPVFRGDKSWIIPVQLRYRREGGVKFFYDVYRMDLHFFESVKAACAKVAADTGLEVLMGAPELSGDK